MISGEIFALAVSLKTKILLPSKFSRNSGSTPRRLYMFCRPGENMLPGSS